MVCPGATERYLSCSDTRRVKVHGVHHRRGDDRDAEGHPVAAISHAEADFVAHPLHEPPDWAPDRQKSTR